MTASSSARSAHLGRPLDPISADQDLAIRSRPGAVRLFKMHGSVDRLDDIVISTDDYELYRKNRGAFLPLMQAHMTSFSMLFIGLSFADPNLRHVLSLIRESFTTSPPEHFAIVRPPHRETYSTEEEFQARLIQHKLWAEDLQRYGLQVVEVESYDEVPELLRDVERRVARNRVWVSGSWPPGDAGSPRIAEIAESVGTAIGAAGMTLVSGSGLVVSPAVISGFLSALQRSGSWDLERRLLVRPFSQPIDGAAPNLAQWAALRAEMARVSGAIVFIGGAKPANGGGMSVADGVMAERDAANEVGAFLLPVGASGGAAEAIAQELIGSSVPDKGLGMRRPTDAELQALMKAKDPGEVAKQVAKILARFVAGRGQAGSGRLTASDCG